MLLRKRLWVRDHHFSLYIICSSNGWYFCNSNSLRWQLAPFTRQRAAEAERKEAVQIGLASKDLNKELTLASKFVYSYCWSRQNLESIGMLYRLQKASRQCPDVSATSTSNIAFYSLGWIRKGFMTGEGRLIVDPECLGPCRISNIERARRGLLSD